MGYSSDEPLAHDVDAIVHMTPSELRRLSSAQLVTKIADRLTPAPRFAVGDTVSDREIDRAPSNSGIADASIAKAG